MILHFSEHRTLIKEVTLAKSESILGLNQNIQSKDWITVETWNEIKRVKQPSRKLTVKGKDKGKVIPLQARCGPEGG